MTHGPWGRPEKSWDSSKEVVPIRSSRNRHTTGTGSTLELLPTGVRPEETRMTGSRDRVRPEFRDEGLPNSGDYE